MRNKEKIAIGITMRNRTEETDKTIDMYSKFTEGSDIFVVDDFSLIPYERATHRNVPRIGVAGSKNKCLSLMSESDPDYYVLSDNDAYPTDGSWIYRYIDAHKRTGIHYFSCTFHDPIGVNDGIAYHESPNGFMIFMTRKAVQTIGGMDTRFGLFGHEHVAHQLRAYNAGLSPYKFSDIENPMTTFCALDQDKNHRKTLDVYARAMHLKKSKKHFYSVENDDNFIPFS